MKIEFNLIENIQSYIDKYYTAENIDSVIRSGIIAGKDNAILSPKNFSPDLLQNIEPTFSQTLFKFIKQQNISEINCYKNADIDRKLFSKIRSHDDYNPKKDTVFALIIGLKLNLADAEKLLDSAGYSISHSIKKDVIMEYIIKEKIYDIIEVNNILEHFKCSLI